MQRGMQAARCQYSGRHQSQLECSGTCREMWRSELLAYPDAVLAGRTRTQRLCVKATSVMRLGEGPCSAGRKSRTACTSAHPHKQQTRRKRWKGISIQNGRPYLFCQPLRVLHENDSEMQWLHLVIAALCCQLLRILQGTSTSSAPCTSRFSDSGVPALIL